MSDKFTAPYLSKDQPAPASEQWAAKRDLAQQIRDLTDAVVTSDATVAELNEAVATVAACKEKLTSAERLLGQRSFEKAGKHDQVYLELNGFGGLSNPLAPGVNIWFDGDRAYGEVEFGWAHEGPPSTVHGGFVSALFDQFLGIGQFATGIVGMTASLAVSYKKPSPLNETLNLEAWSDRMDGRKHYMKGVLRHGDLVTAEVEALFIRPKGGIGLKGQDTSD